MSRKSLLLILKTISVVMATFCLYQLHVLLQPRILFVNRTEPQKQMSDLETRAFDQLRIQVLKNEQLREKIEQRQVMFQQKFKELDNVIVQQKKQIQILQKQESPLKTVQQPLQQHKITQQPEQQLKPTTQHPLQHLKEASQPVRFQQMNVHGQTLTFHPNVSVISSIPSTASRLTPKMCLPLPHSPRRATICIHDPKIDTVISGALQAGKLWEENYVLHMVTVLKENPEVDFVDIGANIGTYTLLAAASGRNVLSVDLLDANIMLLQYSLQLSNLSSQVTIVKNAVYKDHNSKLGYKTYQNNTARTFITENSQLPPTVQSVCLDDLIPLARSKSVYMRIDTGNSDHHALVCGHEFFSRINVKVLQIKWSQKSQEQTDKITSFLNRYNYTAHTLVGTSYQTWELKVANWTGEVFFLHGGL